MKIETLEQLSEVPEGAVLRDRVGDLWDKDGEFWCPVGVDARPETFWLELYLPATVLIPSVVSQEQLDKAAHEVRRLQAEVERVKAEAWAEGWNRGYTDRHSGRIIDGYIEIDPTPNPYRKDTK